MDGTAGFRHAIEIQEHQRNWLGLLWWGMLGLDLAVILAVVLLPATPPFDPAGVQLELALC